MPFAKTYACPETDGTISAGCAAGVADAWGVEGPTVEWAAARVNGAVPRPHPAATMTARGKSVASRNAMLTLRQRAAAMSSPYRVNRPERIRLVAPGLRQAIPMGGARVYGEGLVV